MLMKRAFSEVLAGLREPPERLRHQGTCDHPQAKGVWEGGGYQSQGQGLRVTWWGLCSYSLVKKNECPSLLLSSI